MKALIPGMAHPAGRRFWPLLLLIACPIQASAQFIDTYIDNAPTWPLPSVAIVTNPSNCHSYVAYVGSDGRVRYATHLAICTEIDAPWPIDNGITRYGSQVALAVTLSTGVPHLAIATTGTDPDWVAYATRPVGGNWQYEPVLAKTVGDNIAVITSVSAGEWNGNPYVAYILRRNDLTESLRFATRNGGTWTSEELVSAPAPQSLWSVTLQLYGSQPSIIYRREGNGPATVYFTRKLLTWSTPEVVRVSFSPCALAMGGDGTPHVATTDGNYLWHSIRGVKGGWTHEVAYTGSVLGGGRALAIAVDGSGVPHIAFYRQVDHYYYYAYRVSATNWPLQFMADAGPVGSGADEETCSLGVGRISSQLYPRAVIFTRIDGRTVHGEEGFATWGGLRAKRDLRADIEVPTGWSIAPIRGASSPASRFLVKLPEPGTIELRLFDTVGRLVASRPAESLDPGSHELSWSVGRLGAGLYFVRLSAGGKSRAVTRWVVLE